jgi:hypothetical protein
MGIHYRIVGNPTMALEVLGDPFASSASVSVDEQMIREAAPSMPDTKLQDLLRAANNEQFDKQEGVNEKFLLDKELSSIASTISAELGPFSLDAYANSQDIVSAGALRILNEGDRTGSFRGENARGGSQWDLQQLTVASLEDDDEYGGDPAAARSYSTGRTGDFNIAPKLDTASNDVQTDPTEQDVGSNGDGTHSLDTDTQAVFILGMYQSTNPRVVEEALIDVDDGEDRTSFDVYGNSNLGTLQAFETPSIEYITDDDAFDINGSATENATTDLYPFGVDLNTAANLSGIQSEI